MLKKLDSMYDTKSTPMQIICRSQLNDLKLSNFDNIQSFFLEFEKLSNQYISAGGKLNEEEKIEYLIKALPKSYSAIGDFIDVLAKEKQTVDLVMSKIIEKSLSKGGDHIKSNVSTFMKKSRPNNNGCFTCGRTNHKQKDCWFE